MPIKACLNLDALQFLPFTYHDILSHLLIQLPQLHLYRFPEPISWCTPDRLEAAIIPLVAT